MPSKKAFLKNGKSEKVSDFCQKQHFLGGALVSGVLAPMDASKMPFLAKIGNFFTFEVLHYEKIVFSRANYYNFRNYFFLWQITITFKDTFLEKVKKWKTALFGNRLFLEPPPPLRYTTLKKYFGNERFKNRKLFHFWSSSLWKNSFF